MGVVDVILKFVPVEKIIRYLGKVLTQKDDKVIDYIFEKVEEMDKKSGLKGFEKRQVVYQQIKERFQDLADWVINLLIELAVAYYRYLQERKK